MKLYIPKQHTGYQCDNCKIIITDIPLPISWLNEIAWHYCPDCIFTCKKCHNIFSKTLGHDICSNCQNEISSVL